ncbi:MAG: MCE family protein [Actinobacteria bacterium]|nr:MCE family protein [Actinomycetota bacterium]
MNLLKGKGGTSFLERNQIIIGILSASLVIGISAFSLLLSSGAFKGTYTVGARFSDAAGLKSGDDVKVAGLDAGKVGSVEIDGGEVLVSMKITNGIEMPADSEAEIVIETLLGKKNVTLHSGSSDEALADGDEIALEDTRTPVELLDVANTSVRLLEASDADALETFMEEVTKITQGKRRQVTTLVSGFTKIATAIDERRDELSRLIDNLRTVSATFAERDDTLVSLIDNFDIVLANLAERTDDVQALLENTDSASHEIADLVSRNRSALGGSLQKLSLALATLDDHQVQLAATISYLEDSVKGYQSVGYSQGIPNRWANIFIQSAGTLGMDAFFGPCGAFDQALDDLLGPDPRPCDERSDADDQGQQKNPDGEPAENGAGKNPEDDVQELLDDAPLPHDLGDLLDSVTGSTGLGAALREGLL